MRKLSKYIGDPPSKRYNFPSLKQMKKNVISVINENKNIHLPTKTEAPDYFSFPLGFDVPLPYDRKTLSKKQQFQLNFGEVIINTIAEAALLAGTKLGGPVVGLGTTVTGDTSPSQIKEKQEKIKQQEERKETAAPPATRDVVVKRTGGLSIQKGLIDERTLDQYIDKPKKKKTTEEKAEEKSYRKKGYPRDYQQQIDDEPQEVQMTKEQQNMLTNIYRKYPALERMGKTVLVADKNFTREKTGMGDIEYFDNKNKGRQSIIYPNGFEYKHPQPGVHAIVYNPDTNDEQGIALDMLHGMRDSDKKYYQLRNRFAKAFINANKEDFKRDWEMDKEDSDGRKSYKNNWIDGQIRGLLFEGTPEEFEKNRYWPDARAAYLKDDKVRAKFERLHSYLTTGQWPDKVDQEKNLNKARQNYAINPELLKKTGKRNKKINEYLETGQWPK